MAIPGISQAPFVLEAVGDKFAPACRILAIIWEGATTSGDTAEVRDNTTGELIWAGRTSSTQTYKGIVYPKPHAGCGGFYLGALSAGRVLVYVAQEI